MRILIIYLFIFCTSVCAKGQTEKVSHYHLDTNDIYKSFPEIADNVVEKHNFPERISLEFMRQNNQFYIVNVQGVSAPLFGDMFIQIKDSSIIYHSGDTTNLNYYLNLNWVFAKNYKHTFKIDDYLHKDLARHKMYQDVDTLSESDKSQILSRFTSIEYETKYIRRINAKEYHIYEFSLHRLHEPVYFLFFSPGYGIIGLGFESLVSYNPVTHNHRGVTPYCVRYYRNDL